MSVSNSEIWLPVMPNSKSFPESRMPRNFCAHWVRLEMRQRAVRLLPIQPASRFHRKRNLYQVINGPVPMLLPTPMAVSTPAMDTGVMELSSKTNKAENCQSILEMARNLLRLEMLLGRCMGQSELSSPPFSRAASQF